MYSTIKVSSMHKDNIARQGKPWAHNISISLQGPLKGYIIVSGSNKKRLIWKLVNKP